jgi:acetylornithine/N-succinyldiaminopimelate aminotransferase
MIGIELEHPCSELVQQAAEKGILLNVTAGNVIRLLPPLIITTSDIDRVVNVLAELIH